MERRPVLHWWHKVISYIHRRTRYYMVYDYYSPVGDTGLASYYIEGSASKDLKIWTKRQTIPATSMAEAVEAVAVYAI